MLVIRFKCVELDHFRLRLDELPSRLASAALYASESDCSVGVKFTRVLIHGLFV